MPWDLPKNFETIMLLLLIILAASGWFLFAWQLVRNDIPALQRRLDRHENNARWGNSRLIFVLISAGFLWSAISAGSEAYRWRENTRAARQQTALQVELQIPSVEAGRTYTVVTRFRVHDRPYQSGPIQIRFTGKQSSYPLALYYDVTNPARNSWTKFEEKDPKDLKRAINLALCSLFLGICLLGWAEPWMIRRRLALPPKNL